MDLVTLFTEQKWNILRELAKGKFSPLQLAEKSSTTMANISQQLRLLEFSNMVKKKKIPNRDKGKPRTLFYIPEDYAYVISIMNGFADKKLVKVDGMHKILFKIMFLPDQEFQYYIEKFVWGIEDYLSKIEIIAIRPGGDNVDVMIGTVFPKELEKKIKDVSIKKQNQGLKNFRVEIITPEEIEKGIKKGQMSSFQILYDIKGIFQDRGDN
ncbi:MAG: helix-turn-helix domain-containing protein [Nanoarchaeota archaeon]